MTTNHDDFDIRRKEEFSFYRPDWLEEMEIVNE